MPKILPKTLAQIPVETLKGVGPQMAAKLQQKQLYTVQDLLFHLPARYQDRTRITPIAALRVKTEAVIEGQLTAVDVIVTRRRSLLCRLQDATGVILLRFFHFSAAQQRYLTIGSTLRCYGEVRYGSYGLEFIHPEYSVRTKHALPALDQRLTAIYPSTEGISQTVWRKLCGQALQYLDNNELPELLPDTSIKQALLYLHQPPTTANLVQLQAGQHPYQQQLAFEELVAHTLSVLTLRRRMQTLTAPALTDSTLYCARFVQQLPFTLTAAQQRVAQTIAQDLAQSQPMLRLLQGDVGSGKTVVAALAALQAIASGYQVAIMVPTEILAEQHWQTFCTWLQPLSIKLGCLTAKIKGKKRQQQLTALAEQQIDLMIGTHALFQNDVHFARLGLIIIDEQHRFGVHQRLALKTKAEQQPHQLIMTATPIPRTLAMSVYADLATSTIDQLPPGRLAVQTSVINNSRRQQVMERVKRVCHAGQQVYWVCTLIEESDVLQAQAAEASCAYLQEQLSERPIELIHGRFKADEKARIMADFKAQKIDLLVTTTVIEVGVDVPNATVMIIENAERLGLAQLHQLRGRVGRGTVQSHCILLYQAPLSVVGKQRLAILRQHHDGFVIAEKDLELRGPGEWLGTRQTGLMSLRIADLQRDAHQLEAVKQTGQMMMQQHPEHVDALIQRWLGGSAQYAQV